MNRIHHAAAVRKVTLALGACMALGAQAAVLSSQPANQAGVVYLSTASAQNAESFSLSAPAAVSGFRWSGSKIDVGSFVVRLYAGASPAAVDGYTTLNGGVTRSSNKVFTTSSTSSTDIFDYELTLAAAFSATGTRSTRWRSSRPA